MNVLLIGGTGVLSSAVAAEALRKGIEVTMINRGNRVVPMGVEHIKADKDDKKAIGKALEGRVFDAVIDFLCYSKEETEQSLVFYSHFTNQYFFISSCAVYNTKLLNGQMGDESSPKGIPVWRYSVDKCASEEAIVSISKKLGIHYTIIRPAITYDDTRIPYGIAPLYGYHWTLCARILSGKPIIQWNGGVNRCNMMRVEDFAVGVIGLLGNPLAYDEAFNICGDEAPSWNEVLQALAEALGKEVKTVDISPLFYADCLPSRYGEIIGGRAIDAFNSNQKIKKIVPGFIQKISLKEGVARTVTAYKEHNYQHGIDWRFDADTDRIIKKWCKKNHLRTNRYNLHFTNYLGTASIKDRLLYYYTLHKESIIIHSINRIRKA